MVGRSMSADEKPKKGLGARMRRLSLSSIDKATDWLFKEGEGGGARKDGAAATTAEVASPKARRPSRRAPAPPPTAEPEGAKVVPPPAGARGGKRPSAATREAVAAAAEAHRVERVAKAQAAANAAELGAVEAGAVEGAGAAAAAAADEEKAAAATAAAAAQGGAVDDEDDEDLLVSASGRGGAAAIAGHPHYFETHEADAATVEFVLPGTTVEASVVGFDRKKGRKPTENPYQPKSPTTGIITIFLIDVVVKGLPADWEGDSHGPAIEAAPGGGGMLSWRVRKRYNDFKELHAACIADHLGDELPLPGKSRGAQTDEMLAVRRMTLNAYLTDLCSRPSLPPHVAIELQHFLGCEDNGFSQGELLWKKAVTV